MSTARERRRRIESLRQELKIERASFITHWEELGEYILPERTRFVTSGVNDGTKKRAKIIDGTATQAAQTLASGMTSGITSPSRPWFDLGSPGKKIIEGEGKAWLYEVARRMREVFKLSNLYNSLNMIYLDLTTFAIGALVVEEDFDTVMRFYPQPVGSYMVSVDHRGIVNVFVRELQMTVRQIVEKWGEVREGKVVNRDQFSEYTLRNYEDDAGSGEAYVDIVHAITPNADYIPGSEDTKKRKFISCYYELGSAESASQHSRGEFSGDKMLSERGYDFFPALVARWSRGAGDSYGTNCPGMTTLPDIKQLQKGESKSLKAIDKKVDPPMTGPTSLRSVGMRIRPGDANYVDDRGVANGGMRAAHEINYSVAEVEQKNAQVRQRINDGYYVNLILMMTTSDRREMTAREVDERSGEKLIALGPVLEGLNQDLLDPLIDLAFAFMQRQGLIPEAPEELQGTPLRVEYISLMANAQKAVALSGIERFVGFVTSLIQVAPDVLDKVDLDQVIDYYAELSSVPPDIVVQDDVVAQKRQQRQAQLQQQQEMEAAEQASSAAKNLAGADLDGNNMLSAMAGQGAEA